MATSTSKPGKATGSNVVSINSQAPAVVPVEGWSVRYSNGLLRFDGTDAGRLVRMADLVWWLMETKELPGRAAVELVCDALQSDTGAAAWLYMLNDSEYATPLAQQHSFLYKPILSGCRGSFCEEIPNDPADCGFAGAVKHMRANLADPGGDMFGMMDQLCVRMDKAHALFGWGAAPTAEATSTSTSTSSEGKALDADSLKTFDDLVAYRAANMAKHGNRMRGPDWTIGKQLELLRAELDCELARNGGQKVAARKAVGKRLGCSGENVRQALETERKRLSAPAFPFPTAAKERAAGGRK